MRQQYWARLHSVLGMTPQEMVYGRRPAPVVPLARVFYAAATVADVTVVPEDFECRMRMCTASAGFLTRLPCRCFSLFASKFAKNATAWPSRGGSRRELAQLKPGDLVLEVVSGPVATLGEAVKGPFRVVEVRGNGVVIVATGGTAFKQAELFPRNIRLSFMTRLRCGLLWHSPRCVWIRQGFHCSVAVTNLTLRNVVLGHCTVPGAVPGVSG
jgi:hypothetical protein